MALRIQTLPCLRSTLQALAAVVQNDNVWKYPVQCRNPRSISLGGEQSKRSFKTNGWAPRQIVNLPNALSMARLVSGPIIASWIIDGDKWPLTLSVLAISAATDWADGYAARSKSLSGAGPPSVLGSYLDPLADKVLIGCVVGALGYTDLLPLSLVGVILGRDALLIAGAFWKRASEVGWCWPGAGEFFRLESDGRRKAAPMVKPLLVSKMNTGLQIALVTFCISNEWISWPGETVMWATGVLTAGTTVWSGISYFGIVYGNTRERE